MAQITCSNCGYPWAVAGGNCPNCGYLNNDCFITTAICTSMGKDDRCEELQILRAFRDDYLINLPNGKSELDHYYRVSPNIVLEINARIDSSHVYSSINRDFLQPAINMIKDGERHKAYLLYRKMVNDLEIEFL